MRIKPFLGQIGTTHSRALPDSQNAGDFGSFLINSTHEYAIDKEELIKHKTDGHMDINKIRARAVVIAPVKVKGGGHAMQGNGEIAGHTADVAAVVTLEVKVIKNLQIDGPIIIPISDDLPYLANPIDENEKNSQWS